MAGLLGGLTLVLVLVVLPRRYVLHAGLRESGINFPTTSPPFAPPRDLRRIAVARPVEAGPVLPGPAERFWSEVMPLLESQRYRAALPLFESYLRQHPMDRAVRREQAITLDRAGGRSEAAAAYQALLAQRDEPGLRLLYARSLRDQGRIEEALAQYAALMRADPDDQALAHEVARALAWAGRYDEAASILRELVARHPGDVEARVELAQVLYWAGQLDEADHLLSALGDGDLSRSDAIDLRAQIRAELTPPPPDPASEAAPLTTAERAAQALAAGDVGAAAELYRAALAEQPADTALLRTYADVLQYRLEDLEGARQALMKLQAQRGEDPILWFRIAQLEAWTGRNAAAMARLERLVRARPTGSADALGTSLEAQARALLGDLYRWEGLRVLSADAYQLALREDPANEEARRGLVTLALDVDRQIDESERPRLGTDAYAFSDSDEFTRLDLGMESVSVDGAWVFGGRAGSRVVRGNGIDGASGSERGFFAEVEMARWWHWGTVRSGLRLGMERVRPTGTDPTFGATVHWTSLAGFRADLRYDHGPAYPLTVTLSSLLLPVRQDRVTLTAARQLGRRWSLSVAGDAARFAGADPLVWPEASALRVEGGVSLGRALTDDLVLGISGRALTYSDAAPVSEGRPLFWDPEAVWSLGAYAQMDRLLAPGWELRGRLGPALAWIDERSEPGYQRVPHVSAEGGLTRREGRLSTSMDLFYYQGRFDGYRAWGARLGLAVVDPFRSGER